MRQRLLIFAFTGGIAAILAGSLYQDRHMPKWMMAAYIFSVGLMASAGLSLFFPPMMPFTQYMRLAAFGIIALSHMIEARMSIPAKDATAEQVADARRIKRQSIIVTMGVFVIGMVAFPYVNLLDNQQLSQNTQQKANRTLNKNTSILYDILDAVNGVKQYIETRDSLIDDRLDTMQKQLNEQKKAQSNAGKRPYSRVRYSVTPLPVRFDTASPEIALPVQIARYP